MDPIQPDGGDEGGDIVRKELGRPGPAWLVAFAGAAQVERDAGKLLGVVGDLKGIAGIVCCKIGDQQQRLAGALLLIVDGDVVGLDLRHGVSSVRLVDTEQVRGAERRRGGISRLYPASAQDAEVLEVYAARCEPRLPSVVVVCWNYASLCTRSTRPRSRICAYQGIVCGLRASI